MNTRLSVNKVTQMITEKLSHNFGIAPNDASDEYIYKALALAVRDIIQAQRKEFHDDMVRTEGKQVYYLCMEFLMGRSLKNSLYNLGIEDVVSQAVEKLGVKLEKIYDMEPVSYTHLDVYKRQQ